MSMQYARVSGIIIALAVFGARELSANQAASPAPLASFDQAVAAYAELQRGLTRQLPPRTITEDPGKIVAAVVAQRAAIRRARPHAKAGDIFTADATPILLSRIHAALRTVGMSTDELIRILAEENEGYTPAVVNGTFSWATASAMPASILAALPPLPDMLQYRFVGPDLVLVDVEASLIVDVLPAALSGESD